MHSSAPALRFLSLAEIKSNYPVRACVHDRHDVKHPACVSHDLLPALQSRMHVVHITEASCCWTEAVCAEREKKTAARSLRSALLSV
jgi:hypothetical protein